MSDQPEPTEEEQEAVPERQEEQEAQQGVDPDQLEDDPIPDS